MYRIPLENEQITKALTTPYAPVDFTDEEKEQFRENIGAEQAGRYSNPNLLDNPFFTVNQRGFNSTLTASGGFVSDRWNNGGGYYTYKNNAPYGFTLVANGNGAMVAQNIETIRLEVGKTYTLSAIINGVLCQASGIYSGISPTAWYRYISLSYNNLTVFIRQYNLESGRLNVAFNASGNISGEWNISAVKLELGSVSTLANDSPSDYSTELMKCMRYFVRQNMSTNQSFAYGFAQTATNIRFGISMPAVMRAAPSISYVGPLAVVGNGAKTAITALGASQFSGGHLVTFNATVDSATQYQPYILTATSIPAYIDFSADL